MKIFKNPDLNIYQKIEGNVVYTVGNFDGLHIGHKYLLEKIIKIGNEKDQKKGVITFEKHPKIGKNFIGHLSCISEKEAYFKSIGFDFVLFLNFEKIKDIGFETFIYYLYDNFHLKTLVLGKDNKLGKDGKGDILSLKKEFEKIVEFIDVDFLKVDDQKVSSSILRELLINGNIKKVNELLNEPYKIMCYQEKGRGVGKKIGSPTLNLKAIDNYKIIPKDGVYAVIVECENGEIFTGACNIGKKPTFDCENRTIEVHLLDINEDIISKNFKVKFIEYIREEKKFKSVEELKINIKNDIKKIRRIIGGNSNEC